MDEKNDECRGGKTRHGLIFKATMDAQGFRRVEEWNDKLTISYLRSIPRRDILFRSSCFTALAVVEYIISTIDHLQHAQSLLISHQAGGPLPIDESSRSFGNYAIYRIGGNSFVPLRPMSI